jgi:hypothetical protein
VWSPRQGGHLVQPRELRRVAYGVEAGHQAILDGVAEGPAQADVVVVNGAPALRILVDGEVDTIASMLVENGMVTGLYAVRNPAKLARLDAVVTLTR